MVEINVTYFVSYDVSELNINASWLCLFMSISVNRFNASAKS